MTARFALAGAAAAVAAMATGVGAFAAIVPTESVLGPLARMLDALAPWLLATGGLAGFLALLLGLRRIGGALTLVAAMAGGLLFLSVRAVTLPLAEVAAPNLRVLFYNAFHDNTDAADAILDAVNAAEPDIAVFAESWAVIPARARLAADYAFVSPCPLTECELILATNLEVLRFWRLQLNPVWPARYAVMEVRLADGRTTFVAAAHLAKPWLSGVTEPEMARIAAQLDWLSGPAVVVGDFNMPPWSRPMRALLGETGFRAIRGQQGTWPAGGPLRLPIDHVLVKSGPRVVAVETFGEGLGSNHLGLVADISVPPEG